MQAPTGNVADAARGGTPIAWPPPLRTMCGCPAHTGFVERSLDRGKGWRMSLATIVPGADLSAERWREWQVGNEASNRESATRVRLVFTLIFAALAAWLGLGALLTALWS